MNRKFSHILVALALTATATRSQAASNPSAIEMIVKCGVELEEHTDKKFKPPECKKLTDGKEGWLPLRLDWYSGNVLVHQEMGPAFHLKGGGDRGELHFFLDGNSDPATFAAVYEDPRTSIFGMPDLHYKIVVFRSKGELVIADQPYQPYASALWAKHSEDSANLQDQLDRLNAALDAEAAARAAADAGLQQGLDNLRAALNAEVAARAAADGNLQILLDAERDARVAGDANLQIGLNNEVVARQSADQTLQALLAVERTERVNADMTLGAQIQALMMSLAVEITERVNGDTALGMALAAEATARANGDAAAMAYTDSQTPWPDSCPVGEAPISTGPGAWKCGSAGGLPACPVNQMLVSLGNAQYGCRAYCNNQFIDVTADPNNCGACNSPCQFSNGQGVCQNGGCVVTQCNADFANCDGNGRNGCETYLPGDNNNCGACGQACVNPNPYCSNSACVAQPQSFRMLSFTTNNCQTVEHNTITGDDRGGIAVSNSRVFYTGDSATGQFDLNSLAGASIGAQRNGLTGDIRTGTVYHLGNGNTFINSNGTPITSLLRLDATTGNWDGFRIDLARAINTCGNEGIYAGWDRVLVHSTCDSHVYEIRVPSGQVIDLGAMGQPPKNGCETWATWGIAEFFGGQQYLLTTTNTQIIRTRVPDGQQTVHTQFNNLSDMCSFTYNVQLRRWYWHHEGTSQMSSGDERIGYCNAQHDSP